jgi:hypothetical protein
MVRNLLLGGLLLCPLTACAGGPDLGDMTEENAIAACNKKAEQVTRAEGVEWSPKRAVADKHDRYWEVQGESRAGAYYKCRVNAVNGDFLTYVY